MSVRAERAAIAGAPAVGANYRGTALTVAVGALALVAAPYAAGFLSAPRGFVFRGSLNNVGDAGQYLAALRQGAGGHLLYTNQYTSLRTAPVLMYPLYTAAGFLLSPLRLAPLSSYYLVHIAAAVALLLALWRCCVMVAPARPTLSFAVALFGGGLYLPALLLSGTARLPFSPAALTAPELSLFATLLISPHATAGLAAELWGLTGYLRWRGGEGARSLWPLALGGLLLGLSYPFGLPVLLAVIGADTLVRYVTGPATAYRALQTGYGHDRTPGTGAQAGRPYGLRAFPAWRGAGEVGVRRPRAREWLDALADRVRHDVVLVPALSPALGIAMYYAVLFRSDPSWGASNLLHLPPPGFAMLAAAFGPLAALAMFALARAPGGKRCEASRLIAVWACVNPLLSLAPLPQAERLLSGWSVPLALLAASALARMRARPARRWAAALALSNVTLALLYLSMAAAGSNAAYYEPEGEAASVAWLAAHSTPGDVVMASAGSGNLIVSVARCRVVIGQNFETFNWARAQADVLSFFATDTTPAERAAILRRRHVTLIMVGPYEKALGGFTPAVSPDYRQVYAGDSIGIYAVGTGAPTAPGRMLGGASPA